MKHFPIAVAVFGYICLGVAASATTIDFEAQGASAPNQFSGHLNSPLTIGIATFTGGQLLRNEMGGVDTSAVYATVSPNFFVGAYTDPLTIAFSQSVSNFSVLITNEFPDTYTITDNNGTMSSATVNFYETNQMLSLTDSGINQITIASSVPMTDWDFAIDNVNFTPTAVPEPAMFIPIAAALLSMLLLRRRAL